MVIVIRQIHRLVGVPANQLAFIIRYSVSILLAQIESVYVTLPNIAKKNRAGDKPSHLVLKFLTDLNERLILLIRMWTYRSAEFELRAANGIRVVHQLKQSNGHIIRHLSNPKIGLTIEVLVVGADAYQENEASCTRIADHECRCRNGVGGLAAAIGG